MRTLVTGGHVIDPAQGIDEKRDLLIEHGHIKALLKTGSKVDDAEVIDAQGLIVTPGFIDLHTHLREPGEEYKETIATGTRAAAAGGYTSICAMANTKPVNDQASITLSIKQRARETGVVRVYPIGALTKGLEGRELAAIGDLHKAGCLAVSDDGLCVKNSQVMRLAMAYASTFNIPVLTHSIDPWLSAHSAMNEGKLSQRLGIEGEPSQSETIMIARDIYLAELTQVRLHVCHVSTAEGVELIRRAKVRGLKVTAEVTPHHLLLTEQIVDGYNTLAKMSPPLRTEADRLALIEGLIDGTIDAIATDHAPHAMIDKEVEFDRAACGVIGLETTLGVISHLLNNKMINYNLLIAALTQRPAKIMGLQTGSLQEGWAADVVLFDPEARYVISADQFHSKSRNSPFIGFEARARVIRTMVGGFTVHHFSGGRA